MWIRDGVLVDRMHINPVAFAFVAWVFSSPRRRSINTNPSSLINFAFEKSGVSCREKLQMYNAERENIVENLDAAAGYYNALASEAASNAEFFPGAEDLLRDLQLAGAQNFITSAVEQEVLDSWSLSKSGKRISPYLKEILGKRQNFAKGRDHFEYVRKIGNRAIYYVADAKSEIKTGKEFSTSHNVVPVGFGYEITVEAVLAATDLVLQAASTCASSDVPKFNCEFKVNAAEIRLPSEREIAAALGDAGAATVISGKRDNIMANLRRFFTV